jgi:predicted GNAT family acetyltransferase
MRLGELILTVARDIDDSIVEQLWYLFNLQEIMNIVIRQARKEEAVHIAELFMFAWPVDEILESNQMTYDQLHESITLIASREDTIYSYANTLVADIDGKVVGAICAYDGADYQRFKQPVVDALGPDSGFAQLKETDEGEFYLDSVGVLPEYRGKGIASRLFEAQCERALSLGHRVAGLIVDVDKPQAEALYARLGFVYLDDKDFFGHTMKHMVRQLNMTGQYYRHFKGNLYKVLHIAKNSETLEDMVVYQAMYGERGIWVRPKSMFEEVIERDGRAFRRFSPIFGEEVKKIFKKL